ncbi:PREDICTED: interferon gamma receptor 2 [Sturnus vulgaris]|uniref:interferon gamma receptor 2 n=1 Tax=Sturnus vulgaris TaxID=9172 RepID=UPI00071A0832|nr:PREDICTED: interferon gamma receptor 2 [Sturnus vulgaris]
MGCAQTPLTQCGLPPELGRRWTVQMRVRAELGRLSSAWVQSPAFVPERDTTLGPPRVNSVSATPESLLISVSPPFPPEHGDSLQFLVSYWENSTGPAAKVRALGLFPGLGSGATRAGYIIALFLVAFLGLNLMVAALLFVWKHHQKIKFWAQPPLQIPSHYEEFLKDPGLEELPSPAEEEPLALGPPQ